MKDSDRREARQRQILVRIELFPGYTKDAHWFTSQANGSTFSRKPREQTFADSNGRSARLDGCSRFVSQPHVCYVSCGALTFLMYVLRRSFQSFNSGTDSVSGMMISKRRF